MSNNNLKDTIDEAAAKAKEAAEKAGHAVKDGATKVADKIKGTGNTAGKKLGA